VIRPIVVALAFFGCARTPPALSDASDVADASVVPDADPTSPWRLVWQDEFDGAAGTLPDRARWSAEQGGGGWGNDELQYYTDRSNNLSLDGAGHLAIVARRESFGGRDYTSARLITRDQFQHAYGRFEARMKLPTGQGIWPAFWLLGGNYQSAAWPGCGEIDIMEQRGQAPEVVYGSLHGPGYSGGASLTGTHVVTGGHPTSELHVYAIEWRPGRVEWFVDNVRYYAMSSSQIPSGGRWVYDHAFFLILNVAVGGHFVGSPNGSTPFPQTLLVDYVRVYEAK
jgi:beta-glucanase (GH16 family)